MVAVGRGAGRSLRRWCWGPRRSYLAEASGAGGQQGPTELLHGADSSREGGGREDGSYQVDPKDPGQHFFLAPGDRRRRKRVPAPHNRTPCPLPSTQDPLLSWHRVGVTPFTKGDKGVRGDGRMGAGWVRSSLCRELASVPASGLRPRFSRGKKVL